MKNKIQIGKMTFLIIATLFFNNTNAQTTEQSDDVMHVPSYKKVENKEFKFLKSQFVILNYKSEWNMFKAAKPTDLTREELDEIEVILRETIDKHNDVQAAKVIEHNENNPDNQIEKTQLELKYAGYLRQYVPVVNENGEKEIWLNFMIDNFMAENWQTEIAEVNGGGNLYFNLKINLTKKESYDLKINK